ncbi:SET domain-containing protein 5 [Byssothecium circinans]|uniref:SET domain-containing protein 5 n=1 Tax=Byssothecium circinans TaxID=147558 RepID=A0A6A5U7S6_9PLEO|nr:SET domain-containing protein 5 [Byssothecium circinans]
MQPSAPNPSPNISTPPYYAITTIPGKGKGVIATQKIPRGTRLLSEAPLFTVRRLTTIHSTATLNQQIAKKVKDLPKESQHAFFALHNAHGKQKYGGVFLGIAKTNALPLGAGDDVALGGIFLEASRINHACMSNAQNTWNEALGKLMIHACKDIEEGEEITISYLSKMETHAKRQQELRDTFGFECRCAMCEVEPEKRQESDARIAEIARLDALVGDGMSIIQTPLSCLHNAEKMLRLLEELGCTDARIAGVYYDALQIAIANGDQARAKVFAERACDERVVLEGEDSSEVERLGGLVRRPDSHRLYGTNMRWRSNLKGIPVGLEEGKFEEWVWKKGGRKT